MNTIVDQLPLGVMMLDEKLAISTWNAWLEIHTHITRDKACSTHLDALFPDINQKTFQRRVATTLRLGSPSFYHPSSGYLVPILNDKLTESFFLHMQQGIRILPCAEEPGKVLVLITDQNEMKEAMYELERQQKRSRHYLGVIDRNVLTVTTNEQGVILDASQAFCLLVEEEKPDIIGHKISMFRHPDTDDTIYTQLWKMITRRQTWRGELRNVTASGKEFWVRSSIFFLEEHGGKARYQAIMEDVTDKKTIEKLSVTDELTELYNRRAFNRIFSVEFHRTKRAREWLGFIILDVDNFKKYNDTYGHLEGDKVLVEMGKIMRTHFRRAGDYAFRLGGEEFGILFQGECESDMIQIAERLRAAIEMTQIAHVENADFGVVTASLGLCIVDFNDSSVNVSPDLLYAQTDEALYEAKQSGRNRIVTRNLGGM